MTHRPEVMRERARELLLLCVGGGREVTHDALQGIAREKYSKDTPYVEREEIITQALELHVAARRGEEANVSELSTAEVRMHARDFWSRNPEGTARDAWKYVTEQGTPALKWSSFQSWITVEVRDELGLGSKARRPKKAARATKKPAAKAAPKTAADRIVAAAVRTGTAAAEKRTTVPAVNGNGSPIPERASSEPQVSLAATPEAPPEDDGIARIRLETPVGNLTARDEGRDTWHVEFQGAIGTELLHLLVADLVGPSTMRKEGMAS